MGHSATTTRRPAVETRQTQQQNYGSTILGVDEEKEQDQGHNGQDRDERALAPAARGLDELLRAAREDGRELVRLVDLRATQSGETKSVLDLLWQL